MKPPEALQHLYSKKRLRSESERELYRGLEPHVQGGIFDAQALFGLARSFRRLIGKLGKRKTDGRAECQSLRQFDIQASLEIDELKPACGESAIPSGRAVLFLGTEKFVTNARAEPWVERPDWGKVILKLQSEPDVPAGTTRATAKKGNAVVTVQAEHEVFECHVSEVEPDRDQTRDAQWKGIRSVGR